MIVEVLKEPAPPPSYSFRSPKYWQKSARIVQIYLGNRDGIIPIFAGGKRIMLWNPKLTGPLPASHTAGCVCVAPTLLTLLFVRQPEILAKIRWDCLAWDLLFVRWSRILAKIRWDSANPVTPYATSTYVTKQVLLSRNSLCSKHLRRSEGYTNGKLDSARPPHPIIRSPVKNIGKNPHGISK